MGDPTDVAAETAVVLQLLDRPNGYAMSHLYVALAGIAADEVLAAVDSLSAAGVLQIEGDKLYATSALKHLDALGLVCV